MKDMRQLAAWSAECLSQNYQPNLVLVLVVNEHESLPGVMLLDAAMYCAGDATDTGAARITKIKQLLREAIDDISKKVAGDGGQVVNREDLDIQVTSERPKA